MNEAKQTELRKLLSEWNRMSMENQPSGEVVFNGGGGAYWLLLLEKAARSYDIFDIRRDEPPLDTKEKREAFDRDVSNYLRRRINVSNPDPDSGELYFVSPYVSILYDYRKIRCGELDCNYRAIHRNGILENAIEEMKRYHPLYILREELGKKSMELTEDILKMYEYKFYGGGDEAIQNKWNEIDRLLESKDDNKYMKAKRIFFRIQKDAFKWISPWPGEEDEDAYVKSMCDIYEIVNGKPYNS